MHNNYLFVKSFRVNGQMNKSLGFFVQPKAFELLMLETWNFQG